MVELCSCGKESKYCCPKCRQRTCSLECVKAHKIEKSCSGVADKASFVKLSDFDNIQLISDYKFLENIKESLDNSHRQLVPNFNGQNARGMIKKKCLTNETIIKFMPVTFSRHKQNKTHFKDDVIRWTVELIFSDRSQKLLAHDVSETLKITDLIEKYKSDSAPHSEYRFVSMYFKSDPDVSYFVQADGDTNTFHLLDPDLTIMESMKFKTIIEYPTIFITTKPASFKAVECKALDVRAELTKLGLLNDGKRKRNNRRRSYKRQKKGRNQNNNTAGEDDSKKVEAGKCDDLNEREKTSDTKSNSFKNSVLALFGDEQENQSDGEACSTEMNSSPAEPEEEGEILT